MAVIDFFIPPGFSPVHTLHNTFLSLYNPFRVHCLSLSIKERLKVENRKNIWLQGIQSRGRPRPRYVF